MTMTLIDERTETQCAVAPRSTAFPAMLHFVPMRTITQRELRNQSAQVMDDVERGATYVITRAGKPVAELRPLAQRRRFVPMDEVVEAHRRLPPVNFTRMRAEADSFFGDGGDRVGD